MNVSILKVKNLSIKVEGINRADCVSFVHIAKQAISQKPVNVIQSWLKNSNTLRYLFTWKKVFSQNVKG